MAAAPKEIDADQMLALLGPVPGHIDQGRDTLAQARAQIAPAVQHIAASANRNPAIGILTVVGSILDAILRQAATTKDTVVGPGDTGAAEDLTEPRRSMRFVNHVESNTTAYMRRQKDLREAILYLNMRPCTGDDGCYYNVSATLPPGSVYQVYPNGGVRPWAFPGTGEGLTDDWR